jgi:ribose 5-phosphate isomerase B
MKIHLGTDHAGFELKNKLAEYITELGHEVVDHGAFEFNSDDDYPDFVKPVAESLSTFPEDRGIILGGSGQGEAMCANRHQAARATVFYGGDLEIVKISRQHNNGNILSLGARFISEEEAKNAVKIFLETDFSIEERHIRRIAKWVETIIE